MLISTEHVVYQTTIIIEDAFVMISQMRLNVNHCARLILVVKVTQSRMKFRIRVILLPLHRVLLNAPGPIIPQILDKLMQMQNVETIGNGMEDV